MRLRLLTILSLLAVAVVLAACGNDNSNVGSGNDNASGAAGLDTASTGGEVEAIPEGQYADIGGLKYQVQISRELNPADPEDHGNLIAVAGGQTDPDPKDTWFGIWM